MRVYIESSVISYMVARPSRDIVVLGHQQVTQEWWKKSLPWFEACVSPIVIEEVSAGDKTLSKRRLELVRPFTMLQLTDQAELLVGSYIRGGFLPEKALRDALHIAIAAVHEIEYLVTWNCRHIANGEIIRMISRIHLREGHAMPTICTPEELFRVRR